MSNKRLKNRLRALVALGALVGLLAGCYAQSASQEFIGITASGSWSVAGTVDGAVYVALGSGDAALRLSNGTEHGALTVVSQSAGTPAVTAELYVQSGYVHAVLGSATFDPAAKTTIATATAGAAAARLEW